MLGYYGDMGHYFASVNPVPHFTEQEGIVDLVFEVDEDRPRYVRDVNVTYGGDYPHTKQTVVLDRIQVQPGDLADPKLIRRGRSRLNGSGLFEPGIGFEVTPVEPERNGFASVSRTWRGQNPGHSPGDWTQRFTLETHRSACETVMGEYQWNQVFMTSDGEAIVDSAITADSSDSTSTPLIPTQSKKERTTSVSGGSESRPPAARAALLPTHRHQYVSSRFDPTEGASTPVASIFSGGTDSTIVEPLTSPSMPAVGHSFGRGPAAPAAAPAPAALQLEHRTARPVFESDLMGFRTVEPGSFFSMPTPVLVASHGMNDSEEPVIRAQSPQRQPVDPSTPAYTAPILEGSPFRNQFRDIPPGWVDIDVNATEGRTGRLMFGAGVNSNAGLVGSFVWDESNFDLFRPPTTFSDIIEGRAWRGGGQRFRAEAAPGNQVSRYTLSWTDPYFMYTDYSLSVSGFYFNRFYPDWTEDRYGGRVAFGKQFTPEWSGALALRLEDVEMKNPRTPTPAVVVPSLGNNFLSTLRASATHDTRDSSMMPTEGHYFDAGYEQAFAEFTFPKLETEFRQYFTVYNRPDGSGRQVLTFAGVLGWSGDDTPTFERYYAGGFQSFRGFAYRGVTPRQNNFATGGTFQALGTVEYRVPVTADDMINVVAFSDFGTVDDQVSLSQFRTSVGFGLRVVIPAMGPVPLAFDFSFPVAKQSFDNEQIFSFYVGINR
jgi:outer membrane protein insertion porin family